MKTSPAVNPSFTDLQIVSHVLAVAFLCQGVDKADESVGYDGPEMIRKQSMIDVIWNEWGFWCAHRKPV